MLEESKRRILTATERACRKAGKAVVTKSIWDEARSERPICKDTLLRGLRELAKDGYVHSYSVANRNLWWPEGIDPKLPERIEVKIVDAVKELNRETGTGASLIDIAKKAGLKENTVRYYIRYGRCDGIKETHINCNKSVFTAAEDAKVVECPTDNPITKAELIMTIQKTLIGDTVSVDYPQPREGNQKVSHVKKELTVKRKTSRLCVLSSGDSVRWSDMALYYRAGRRRAIEMPCPRKGGL